MLDPATKGVHITRDVTWLRRMFYPLAAVERVVPTMDIVEVPDNVLQGDAMWKRQRQRQAMRIWLRLFKQ